MAELLNGAPVAERIKGETLERSIKLREKGIIPALAIIRVGEKPGDLSYEAAAERRCARTGIDLKKILLPETVTTETLISVIDEVNADNSIHACLIFRPLPGHIDENTVCERLAPQKDVDGITSASKAAVYAGTDNAFAPCTARACIEVLDHYGIKLSGKNAAVIGRSEVIGRPVAMMLLSRNATVTVCHTKTENMPDVCRGADILVAAAGQRKMVDALYVSRGQIVIDVGINPDEDGKICGDVDIESVEGIAGAVTPVPGGVGAVTTAVLCMHTVLAAERSAE